MKKLLIYLIILFLLFNLIFVINPLLIKSCIEKRSIELRNTEIKQAFSHSPCEGLFEKSYRIVQEKVIFPHAIEMMNFYAGYMEKINILLGKPTITYEFIPLQNKTIPLFRCEQDSDCIIVPRDECGCTAGGSDISINKKYREYWIEQGHRGTNCLFYERCRSEVRCIENSCKAIPYEK